MPTDILPITISYNDLFRNLAYISCSGLDHPKIHAHLNVVSVSSINSGFRTKPWYDCLTSKIIFAKKIFDTLEDNESLCVADADIVYFNSQKIYELKSIFDLNDIDFLAQMEHTARYPIEKNNGRANCGFFALKKNDRTRNLFNYVLEHDLSQFKFAEQDVINKYLTDNKVKYELLNPKVFLMGCLMDSFDDLRLENLALLHTTCTNDLWNKIGQIIKFRQRFNLPAITWNNYTLTKKEVTHYVDGSIIFDQ